jgi:hypothetical protein
VNKKRLIIIIVVLALAAVLVSALISIVGSKQSLSIELEPDTSLTLYKSKNSEDPLAYDESNPVLNTSQSVTAKVKKGTYIYVAKSSSSDYKELVSPVDVADTPQSIKIKLSYTDNKLKSVAQDNKSAIESVLNLKYPQVIKDYTVADVQSFTDGNWFGVRLNPKSPSGDVYLCVFKKAGSSVELATDPPSIILSKSVFPDVPRDVIVGTNKMVKDLN